MYQKVLNNEFEIRELDTETFGPLWELHSKNIFQDNSPTFRIRDTFTAEETEKWKILKAKLGTPFRVNLGLFHKENFVGWSWGFQESAETFYMCNSAVLPHYRKQGYYTQLMNAVVDIAVGEGFQRLYSRHTITNNAIIIPKLKRGFVITNFELNVAFGTLIHLTYFPKEIARKILDYRAGQIQADDEIKKQLDFHLH